MQEDLSVIKHVFCLLISCIYLIQSGFSLQKRVQVVSSAKEANIDSLYKLANALSKKNTKAAIKYADAGIALARKNNQRLHLGDGYYIKGALLHNQGEINPALEYLYQAKGAYESIDHKENLADVYARMGQILSQQENHKLAQEYFSSALKIADGRGDTLAGINYRILLAKHHNDYTGRYGVAIRLLQEAENSAVEANDSLLIGKILLQQGRSHLQLDQFDASMACNKRAIAIFSEFHENYYLIKTHLQQGHLYAMEARVMEMENQLQEINALIEHHPDLELIASLNFLKAYLCYLKQDFPQSLKLANEVYDSIQANDIAFDKPTLISLLLKLNYITGNTAHADSLFGAYQEIQDHLYAEQSILSDAELRDKFEADKQRQQLKVQNLELKNIRIQRITIATLFIIALTIAGVFRFRYRENKRINAILASKNTENETLLREIHHRVRNNLQMISSLFNMQARITENPDVLSAINESKSRLKSIALIHHKLYQQDRLSCVNVHEYVENLCEYLLSIYENKNVPVTAHVHASDIHVNADTAVPLGLIITELITNSLKYAFHQVGHAEINIHLQPSLKTPYHYHLQYQDNGCGLPKRVALKNPKSMGLRLIQNLTYQLTGVINYRKKKEYATFDIYFNELS